MANFDLKHYDIDNPLKDKIGMLTEYFVKFYGEKYRNTIINRFQNATFIFTDRFTFKNTLEGINDFYEEKINKLKLDFLTKIHICDSNIEYDNLDFNNWTAFFRNENKDKNIDENLIKFLSKILNQEEGTNIVEKAFSDKKLNFRLQKLLKKFALTKYKYDNKILNLMSEKKQISKPYQALEQQMLDIEEKFKIKKIDKVKECLADALNLSTNSRQLEEKTEKCLNILENDDYKAEKASKFMKLINSPSKFDSKNIVTFDKLIESINKIDHEKDLECIQLLPAYQKLKSEFQLKNLYPVNSLSSLVNFISNSFDKNIGGYVESTYLIDNPQQVYSIGVFPTLFLLDNNTLVHELNHVVQSDIISNSNFQIIFKCGLSKIFYQKNAKVSYGEHDISLLNEVMTEYFSCKIDQQMKNDKKEIGLNQNSQSYFSNAFPLLGGFIENNIETLKECTMSNQPDLIYQKFGKKNIDILAHATYKLLTLPLEEINLARNEIFETVGTTKSIYDILDQNYNFSSSTNYYLQCFKEAQTALKKLEFDKHPNFSDNKKHQSNLDDKSPVEDIFK